MKEVTLLALMTIGSCGWNAAGTTGCEPMGPAHALPDVLRESSGVAWSRTRAEVIWSHNDGGDEATLYALNLEGGLLGTLPLEGARNQDWEDIATGQCGDRWCIYVADTGDNSEVRERLVLYRVEDTGSWDGTERPAEAFPISLPNGPRDIEAIFVLPGEEVYFVTKGRNHPATVYRYPPPLRANEAVVLEYVQFLSEGALPILAQVTGADASPDGALMVLRTYRTLLYFSVEDGRFEPLAGGRVDLRTLNEPQGEAVALGPAGRVVLTSERSGFGLGPEMRLLACGVGEEPT